MNAKAPVQERRAFFWTPEPERGNSLAPIILIGAIATVYECSLEADRVPSTRETARGREFRKRLE